MKLRRVSRLSTLKQYEGALVKDLIPKYLDRSLSKETADEVMDDLKMGCANDPFIFTCVILDDSGKPVGFLVSHLSVSCKGRQVVVDHVHVPNMDMATPILDMLMDKLEAHTVLWLTFRDPSAWVRLSKKLKHPVEMYGWTLRYSRKEE